jgi:hypothetical protein
LSQHISTLAHNDINHIQIKKTHTHTMLVSTMAINFQEISQATSSELHHITDWMESRIAQKSWRISSTGMAKNEAAESDSLPTFPQKQTLVLGR